MDVKVATLMHTKYIVSFYVRSLGHANVFKGHNCTFKPRT